MFRGVEKGLLRLSANKKCVGCTGLLSAVVKRSYSVVSVVERCYKRVRYGS